MGRLEPSFALHGCGGVAAYPLLRAQPRSRVLWRRLSRGDPRCRVAIEDAAQHRARVCTHCPQHGSAVSEHLGKGRRVMRVTVAGARARGSNGLTHLLHYHIVAAARKLHGARDQADLPGAQGHPAYLRGQRRASVTGIPPAALHT